MTTTLIPDVANILRVFARADIADVNAGIDWYADARESAAELAQRHGYSVEVAAGVISALSPLNEWSKNLRDADRVLGGNFTGCLGVSLDKARRIMAGEDIVSVLHADKTVNFYLSILSAGKEGVCVDRHAFDIAVGFRSPDKNRSIGKRLYRDIAAAYTLAADIITSEGLPVTPAEVQSVTWEEHRREWKDRRVSVLTPLFEVEYA